MHTALRRLLSLVAFVPALAFGHPSAEHALSFASGIVHPFGGIDHLLAMLAVGMLAAKLEGRALWILPLSFMAMLTTGAVIGIGHEPSALVETAVAASIVAFGLLLAINRKLDVIAAAAVVGTFALAHGYAHGSEATDLSAVGYLSGMLLASAGLHALGIVTVSTMIHLKRSHAERVVRLIGTMLALIGAGLMFS
jgi:urease accessory protein